MDYQPNIASGSLNRSTFKYGKNPETGRWELKPGANPKAADYFGSLKIDVGHPNGPIVLDLSAWIHTKKDGSGDKFLSISAKYGKNESRTLAVNAPLPTIPAATPAPPENPLVNDADLPF